MQIFGWETPFFRLRGPFEELGNVGLVFVVLQLLRIALGTVIVAMVELFFCRGAMPVKTRQKLHSAAWYAAYYTVVSMWGAALFVRHTGWAAEIENVCIWESVTASFGTWRSLHVYHCVQVAFYLNYLFAMVSMHAA